MRVNLTELKSCTLRILLIIFLGWTIEFAFFDKKRFQIINRMIWVTPKPKYE